MNELNEIVNVNEEVKDTINENVNENANENINEAKSEVNSKKENVNREKASYKSPMMGVLIFFAIIGFICVLAAAVFGVASLAGKVNIRKELSKNEASTEADMTNGLLDDNAKAEESSTTSESTASSASAETTASLAGDLSDAVAPDMTATDEEDKGIYDDGKLQIVFLGDSIIDNYRDESGICGIIMQNLDATVYNLGIGGTTASIEVGANWDNENWNYTCGAGVAKAIAGQVDPDKLMDCTAKKIIKEHKDEFKNTDIFIVEYGVNDFMYGRTIVDDDNSNNLTTYSGAIRSIISSLQSVAPNAKIILCQPSFVNFYRGNGEFIGNSYTLNNGPGTEMEYGGALYYIAYNMGLYFFDFDSQGITVNNCEEYLLDGVHLNDAGRAMYAENLTNYIKSHILDTSIDE